MGRLRELMAWIDALSFRERGLILVIALFVFYGLWDTLLMQPLDAKQEKLSKQLEQTQQEVLSFQQQAQTIVESHGADPNAKNRVKLEKLQKELDAIKEELKQSTAHLIPPEQMAKVLETVLKQSDGLNFVRLEGLGVTPLVEKSSVETFIDEAQGAMLTTEEKGLSPDRTLQTAYLHGLRIEFEGGYLDTLDYLHKLEALPWAFFWDKIDYQVEEYPKALSSITIYTLSLDENWIGV